MFTHSHYDGAFHCDREGVCAIVELAVGYELAVGSEDSHLLVGILTGLDGHCGAIAADAGIGLGECRAVDSQWRFG